MAVAAMAVAADQEPEEAGVRAVAVAPADVTNFATFMATVLTGAPSATSCGTTQTTPTPTEIKDPDGESGCVVT